MHEVCWIMLLLLLLLSSARASFTVKLKDILMIRDVTLVTQTSATHEASRVLKLQIAHLTFSRFCSSSDMYKYKYEI